MSGPTGDACSSSIGVATRTGKSPPTGSRLTRHAVALQDRRQGSRVRRIPLRYWRWRAPPVNGVDSRAASSDVAGAERKRGDASAARSDPLGVVPEGTGQRVWARPASTREPSRNGRVGVPRRTRSAVYQRERRRMAQTSAVCCRTLRQCPRVAPPRLAAPMHRRASCSAQTRPLRVVSGRRRRSARVAAPRILWPRAGRGSAGRCGRFCRRSRCRGRRRLRRRGERARRSRLLLAPCW